MSIRVCKLRSTKVNVSPGPESPAVHSPQCQSHAGPGGRCSVSDSVPWECSTPPQTAGPSGLGRLPPLFPRGRLNGWGERGGRGVERAPWPVTPSVSSLRWKRDAVLGCFFIGKQENVTLLWKHNHLTPNQVRKYCFIFLNYKNHMITTA